MEDDVRIERARREDLPGIIALARLIWRTSYPGIISGEQIEFMLDWMYDLKKLEAELESDICFVRLMAGGALRGFASFGPEQDEMKLHKIYIHPDWQRRGMGNRLLKYVESEAMARGFKKLILGVNKQNRPAIEAYQKNGFTIRTSMISEIGNGFVMDDYLMEKGLCRI